MASRRTRGPEERRAGIGNKLELLTLSNPFPAMETRHASKGSISVIR
jgi:hypothetical protein